MHACNAGQEASTAYRLRVEKMHGHRWVEVIISERNVWSPVHVHEARVQKFVSPSGQLLDRKQVQWVRLMLARGAQRVECCRRTTEATRRRDGSTFWLEA